MAENDTHYNNTPDMMNGGGYGITTPLPGPGEGGPVGPDMNAPVIPLPEPGEGGPVFPGMNGPVIPLPEPGEGGPVGPDMNAPVVPLPEPGEGGPVGPSGPGSGWFPIFPGAPTYPSFSPQFFGQVRFLNASTNSFPVNITIDNAPYAIYSRFGTISNYDWISDGFHTVTVRRASGMRSILLQQTFPFAAGQKVTMVLTDTPAGGLEMIRVIDTGCSNMPYNTGCYRFANMSYSGSSFDLALYNGETVFRNVRFQNVTAYKQAMAGSYQFYVTNSNAFRVVREIPIIVVGVAGVPGNLQEPVTSFTADIAARKNYTSYLIGNTWTEHYLRVLTVED